VGGDSVAIRSADSGPYEEGASGVGLDTSGSEMKTEPNLCEHVILIQNSESVEVRAESEGPEKKGASQAKPIPAGSLGGTKTKRERRRERKIQRRLAAEKARNIARDPPKAELMQSFAAELDSGSAGEPSRTQLPRSP
jgi:hypothetical protein